jgi:hypothetical protein
MWCTIYDGYLAATQKLVPLISFLCAYIKPDTMHVALATAAALVDFNEAF